MPVETQQAIEWAKSQTVEIDGLTVEISGDTPHLLVDKVREYFNAHGIAYSSFSYDDIEPLLN